LALVVTHDLAEIPIMNWRGNGRLSFTSLERLRAVDSNPLRPLAVISVLSIASTLYHAIKFGHAAWIAVTSSFLAVIFLVFYFARHRIAWFVALIFAALAPVYFLALYITSPRLLPSGKALLIGGAAWLFFLIWIFYMREHYYFYLKQSAECKTAGKSEK
jgi:hypothetical protein